MITYTHVHRISSDDIDYRDLCELAALKKPDRTVESVVGYVCI